jgi:membrane protein DedA with SNARE-associated domain
MEQTIHHLLVAWMQFILDWGYIGILIMMALESTALPIPAEVVIPPAAFWAAQGRFTLWGVILAATVGSLLGSAGSYWIAERLGRPLFDRYGKYVFLPPHKLHAADRWFDAYGSGGIFVARLLPGIRHVISLPAGMFRMNFRRFCLMTVMGAGLFNGALAWFGLQVLGDQPALVRDPTALRHALSSKSYWLVGFGVVVAMLYGLMVWMQKRADRART